MFAIITLYLKIYLLLIAKCAIILSFKSLYLFLFACSNIAFVKALYIAKTNFTLLVTFFSFKCINALIKCFNSCCVNKFFHNINNFLNNINTFLYNIKTFLCNIKTFFRVIAISFCNVNKVKSIFNKPF